LLQKSFINFNKALNEIFINRSLGAYFVSI